MHTYVCIQTYILHVEMTLLLLLSKWANGIFIYHRHLLRLSKRAALTCLLGSAHFVLIIIIIESYALFLSRHSAALYQAHSKRQPSIGRMEHSHEALMLRVGTNTYIHVYGMCAYVHMYIICTLAILGGQENSHRRMYACECVSERVCECVCVRVRGWAVEFTRSCLPKASIEVALVLSSRTKQTLANLSTVSLI